MPKDSSRQPLPTSSSDFALPPSSSPGASSFNSLDDPNILFNRIRRPSLLQRSHHSPLSNAYAFHARRRSQASALAEESESEKERMSTDSPSSSENHTPPLKAEGADEDPATAKPKPAKTPLTPPRRRSSTSIDSDMPTIFNRRLNFPLKQPRILKLLAETTKPEDDEVKSEAAFQRLIHSVSELPRTPRPLIDRGRYPEEAGHEEDTHREATPSDDEVELDDTPFAYNAPNATQPISIRGRGMITPSGSAANSVAGSVTGSVNGDDQLMCMSEASSSYNGGASTPMDVDMAFGSPLLNSMSAMPSHSWRYTPPPTATSAVRNNKRKLDDSRFDPYPTSSKRRAVSPSLHYLNSHSTTNSPISRASTSRGPIAIPLQIPTSVVNSAASSPTVSGPYPPYPRMINSTNSPTMRSNSMLLASPIIRPIPRRRQEEEERVVESTGQQVQGLQLRDL
ncbi:hypothetical protein FA13DRAFT_1724890 [Coprinellus micaceus]|uniref:Uncharacterized protein n=1 Tax=Coprinellus micaceus TaxID=71717 RepID=A0A4Y7TXQ3_COPMI|nr:hypothetical protein FA13DRAFT_1724890 [Coprinellus micaceus]